MFPAVQKPLLASGFLFSATEIPLKELSKETGRALNMFRDS